MTCCARRVNAVSLSAMNRQIPGRSCPLSYRYDPGVFERTPARTVPDASLALAALPMHLVAEVGASRVAIVHGDLESLAGWDLAQEHADDDPRRARTARQMARADVRIVLLNPAKAHGGHPNASRA